jgi:extradiol dioxygenase family protein
MADAGWCWDGQAINGQWQFTIFGAGEGTKWFGLKRCCFMFHPNTAMAMEKLRDMKEIVCEISKWECQKIEGTQYKGLGAPMRMNHDGRIERKCREAEIVSKLSRKYPNVTGAFDDDLYGKIKAEHITPEQYAAVRRAVKSANPKLKHWGVVYSHELKKENWAGFTDSLDVVTLWVWASKNLVNLDRYVEQCREIFPGKPINVGCYLRDFTLLDGVPMEMLKVQWEFIRKALRDGTIQGYSILGGFLIDIHPEQATWVRDFIKAN